MDGEATRGSAVDELAIELDDDVVDRDPCEVRRAIGLDRDDLGCDEMRLPEAPARSIPGRSSRGAARNRYDAHAPRHRSDATGALPLGERSDECPRGVRTQAAHLGDLCEVAEHPRPLDLGID